MLIKLNNTMLDHNFNFYVLDETEDCFSGISEFHFYYLLDKYRAVENFPNNLRVEVLMKNTYEKLGEAEIDVCKFNFLARLDVDKIGADPIFVFGAINDFMNYSDSEDEVANNTSCYNKAIFTYKKYINFIDRFMLVYLIDFLCMSFHPKKEFDQYLKIHSKSFC